MITGSDPADAVRAAVAVAARHGVRCADPVVLRDGSNVLVHLRPTPVVARVAALTALVRPAVAATLAKDLGIAGWLAARGVPVAPPSAELPAGPHHHDGRCLTFWTFVEHDPRHVFRPGEVGPLLAELHAELRGYPGELPALPPLDVPDVLAALRSVGSRSLPEHDRAALAADAVRVTGELLAATDESVPLHGDAHPGNLLSTPAGPVWTDFEDSWRGPIGWDLACLAGTGRLDGWAAVASYPGAPERAALAPFVAARQVQSLAWSLVFAERFPTPERQASVAAQLAAWRT
jgi:Ser/Thr protein kinase RdoA (MazF antagonist)